MVKNPPANAGDMGSIPGEGTWQPFPVFLPGKPRRQRGLTGYSPRGRTDSVGPAFLCPSLVQAAQATRCLVSTLSQVCGAFYHLPGPIRLFSWVCSGSAVSGVLCVSSGELISECNPPGRCQPSRIPERLGWQLGETAHNLVENTVPRAETAPRLPALAGTHLPLCLWQGEGLVHSWLALLWYLLNLLFCEQARLCL